MRRDMLNGCELSALLDKFADAAIVMAVDTGRIALWNLAAQEMFGYSAREAIGQPVDLIMPPAMQARHAAGLAVYRETGHGALIDAGKPMELRAQRRSGETFAIELTLSRYGEGDGPSPFVLALIRDVSARRRAEARLAEAQQLARLGWWEWDLSRDRVEWSDELFRLFSLDPDRGALSLKAFLSLVHPQDRPAVEQTIERSLHKRSPFDYEARIIRPDGETRVIRARGQIELGEGGTPVRMLGTVQDVTDQTQAASALRRSNAILQAQQEAAIDGILVIDEGQSVIDFNRRFMELWGIPDALMATRDDKQLLRYVLPKLQYPDEFIARVQQLYQHPQEVSFDEILMQDGRVLDRYSAPVHSATGEYFGRVWYFRDMTERKRMEETLKAQYAQLKELDRLKSEFVNAVSHELRTPLTSIIGYTEFLEDELGGPLMPQQLEFVHETQKAAQRLGRLVDDLLDFARMEAGTFRLKLEDSDLGVKIREIASSLRPQANDARLNLVVSIPNEPLMVRMDPQRIGQVLINLLNNAIKFTPPGGTIQVRTQVEGDHLLCEVEDTGIGIAPEDLPKLFQKFSQLESGARRGGTGLGLSISKTIVTAHEGRIGVRSDLGKGSTFWFILPLREDLPFSGPKKALAA